ncbi:MAG: hypothetical protein EA352_08290 [Gemmatimonadales bacterium]|nr:MAG: hypothetical protein EA352_08290 [Gemmatimonadales bacterium]
MGGGHGVHPPLPGGTGRDPSRRRVRGLVRGAMPGQAPDFRNTGTPLPCCRCRRLPGHPEGGRRGRGLRRRAAPEARIPRGPVDGRAPGRSRGSGAPRDPPDRHPLATLHTGHPAGLEPGGGRPRRGRPGRHLRLRRRARDGPTDGIGILLPHPGPPRRGWRLGPGLALVPACRSTQSVSPRSGLRDPGRRPVRCAPGSRGCGGPLAAGSGGSGRRAPAHPQGRVWNRSCVRYRRTLALRGPVRLLPAGWTRPALLPLLLSFLLLSGCDPSESPEDAPFRDSVPDSRVEVTDDAGRSWTLEVPPGRIVSLVPSATNILRALGQGDRIVGRTDYDDDPELAHLPSVGGGLHPSQEVLLSLEPDLVIRFEGESDRATGERLDRHGIPHLAVRPDTVGDIRRIVRLLAQATGTEEAGEALLRDMDLELRAVADAVDGLDRPRTVFVLGGDPPWVVGSDTFLHELLELAGAENIFAGEGPLYSPVAVEEILRRDPELVLATRSARIPGILERLPVRRVPDQVQAPGLEVSASARALAEAIHGTEVTRAPAPQGGVRP